MSAVAEKQDEPRTKPANGGANETAVAELHDVWLSFGEKQVLSGVSLTARAGERVVVMGGSGSGKSTTLRLLLGILRPDRGKVQFKGREVTKLSRRRLNRIRQKIGMVYQYSALLSSLNVRDNLALPLEELTDKGETEIDEIVRAKLELVGMPDTLDKMPAELSGGMKKRIGLARALMLDPELILYDEPTAGLDPVSSSVINELIIAISEKQQTASIIVTHEMDSAFKVATRMAMLHKGKIIIDDDPERVRDSDNPLVAQFITGSTDGPLLEERKSV